VIPIAKYRSPTQRETIIWLVSVRDKLAEYADEWPSDKRNLITGEIIPQMEEWAVKLMDGIAPKEGQAIIQMSKRVHPILIATDFSETDDKITVDSDDYYKLAEHALEFCRFSAMAQQINKMTNATKIKQYLKDNFKCTECKAPDSCELRKVLLTFMVPPLNIDDSTICQYCPDQPRREDDS